MGYTQYWKHTGFTDEQWNSLLGFTMKLIQNTDISIVNRAGDSDTVAQLQQDVIQFNGEGDDSCDTFHLTKQAQDFEFCKTRNLPYDEVVVDVMREAMKLNPNFKPTSDGGWAVFHTESD
jgi:hypothetical protein